MFKSRDGSFVPDIHTWRKHVLTTQAQAFSRIFKLQLAHYLSAARGMNWNEFFWKIGAGPESGRAWRDVVPEKYGAEGLALIEALQETLKQPGRLAPAQAKTAQRTPDNQPTVATSFAFMFSAEQNIEAQAAGFNSAADAYGTSLGTMFANESEESPDEEQARERTLSSGFGSLFND